MSRHSGARWVGSDDVTPGLVAAWWDLVGRAAEPNPFQTPDVVLPTVAHLQRGRRTGLLVVGDETRLDALLAVVSPMRLPPDARRHVAVPVVQALTEPYAQLGTPLVDAGSVEESVAALTSWPIAGTRGVALLMRYFADDGPVAAGLDAVLARRGTAAVRWKTYERAVLGPGTGRVSKNRRSRLKRSRRDGEALAAAVGPLAWEDRAGDPAAVERFLQLESAGWKGEAGTSLAAQPETAAWFRDVCAGHAARGGLELLELRAGDRVAAMQCNLRAGDQVFHFKSAYDEALAEHRPGMQMLARQVEEADEHPDELRDSVTLTDNTLFNQVWPGRRRLSTIVVPGPGPAGAAVRQAVRGAVVLRDRREARQAEDDAAAQRS